MDNLSSSGHLAQITPVGSPNAGTVLSMRWKLGLNAALVAIPALIVSIELLMVWVGFRVRTPAALLFVALGLLSVTLINVGWVGSFPEWPMNRLLVWRLRRACRARKTSQGEKDWLASARVVEWVPRENWGATKLDTAADVMLLRVNDQGVEMEGDSSRYFFPPASIIDVFNESVRPVGCFHRLHYVIVVVRTSSGPMEFPLAYRDHRIGGLRSIRRECAAAGLRESIADIAVGSQSSATGWSNGSLFVDPSHEEIPKPTLIDRNPYASPRLV